MNKISCDICLDLIPLVRDDFATEDSKRAVLEHIETCGECASVFAGQDNIVLMNDKRVLGKIKKQLYVFAIIMIVFGSMLGVGLSESSGLFYNIIIMPVIGVLSYFVLRKRSYYAAVAMFIFVYLWHLVKYLVTDSFDNAPFIDTLTAPMFWAFIYAGFYVLGIIIAALLCYALRKEGKHEKNK